MNLRAIARSRLLPLLLAAGAYVLGIAPGAFPQPGPGSSEPPPPRFTDADLDFYARQVRPILEQNCFPCHGGKDKVRGGLRLTQRAAILKGGDLGPAVTLEQPRQSLLWKAIHYDGLEMPPTGKLPPEQLRILERWIERGLPMTDADVAAKAEADAPQPAPAGARDYWAYQPVHPPPVPAVRDAAWVRNPVDAFILARLEAAGLSPAPPADPVSLVRRLYYDLLGLPPTPEEVDAFVQDPSPQAYERLVDELLSRPQYGEKWGRHWLDLVRFAETNGYERDGPKPNAWRYRDYVIRSFNADKPFDRFLREQLAGDELAHRWEQEGGDEQEIADAIIATGYYRLGLWDDEPVDLELAKYDGLDDIVATTSQVFLGMTLNCARCHDHKIDPLTQADYYRLLAFFRDVPHYSLTREVSSPFNQTDITPRQRRRVYEEELRQRTERIEELTRQMTLLEEEAIRKMPAEDQRAAEGPDRPQVVRKVPDFLPPPQRADYERLRSERDRLRKLPLPPREMALSVNRCLVPVPPTHILLRGNPQAKGAAVEPGFPAVLGEPDPAIPMPAPGARTSGRRSVLADWIASPDNPLTARVLANRLWQHHFGRGLVATPNDFGRYGSPPTHPELLDWLAHELVRPAEPAEAWRLKRMHRLLVTSSTYRQSAQGRPETLKRDPDNQLWGRFPMRRLTAEEIRDSILAVSGQLNLQQYGPSIYPAIPPEVLAGQSRPGEGWGRSPPREAARRSIYIFVKRSLLVPILNQHDLADTDGSCPVRYTTTVPTQSLGLLNGQFSNEQARLFAQRLQREAPHDLAAQVRRGIRLTTGRIPSDEEVSADLAFLARLRQLQGLSETDALRWFCLMQLNTNEFVYLD
jgi:mono/diheme cytochrome c family protein